MENINDITASKRAFYLEYFKYIFLTILAYMYFSYIFNAGDSLSLSLSLILALPPPEAVHGSETLNTLICPRR